MGMHMHMVRIMRITEHIFMALRQIFIGESP